MPIRLQSKDYRTILICLAIALISLFILNRYYRQAFPEASIDFKVNRSQSQEIAGNFLAGLQLDVSDYRHTAVFDYQNDAKVFLERHLGAQKANELMGDKIRLWRWSHRWYKPSQKEEFLVQVTPKGEIVSFDHDVLETTPGEFLHADSAKGLAEKYLDQLGIDRNRLELVSQSSENRPSRADHYFEWELAGFEIHEAKYRYHVTIQGNALGSYNEYLHIPETWYRDYARLRSKNNATSNVAFFFLLLTVAAMLVFLIHFTRHHDVKWKTALLFGICAAVLSFLSDLNNIPSSLYQYPTTQSFGNYLFREIVLDLLYALIFGGGIFFVTASAEPLYREKFSSHLALSSLFTWRGIRSKPFFVASIVGVTMTFAFAAYQTVFYILSQKAGGWAPQDIPYDNMLNTFFPWVFVLLGGFMPAVSEEFISRMFSVPFFEKITHRRWIAVLIPAFIWGFAHANYEQQPFYIRGIEVGVAGVVIGVMMIRFGILAPLIWHYTIDALYTGLILFRSGNDYFIITAAISCGIILLPLLISIGAYAKKRSFSDAGPLTNSSAGVSRLTPADEGEEAKSRQPFDYEPLSRRRKTIGLTVGLVLLSLRFLPVERIGDYIHISTSARQASHKAEAFLTSLGFNLSGFRQVTSFDDFFDSDVTKYVLLHRDVPRVNKLYADETPGARWSVRYFKELQKEEYTVTLDPVNLRIVSFSRSIEEDAPAPEIDTDTARSLADQVAEKMGYDVSKMKEVQASRERRPNRSDFHFVWEARQDDDRNIDQMRFRLGVYVSGDTVSQCSPHSKLPEEWLREHRKRTALDVFLLSFRILLVLCLTVFAVLSFIKQTKQGRITWKKPLFLAGGLSGIFILDSFSQLGLLLQYYPTTTSLALYNVSNLITIFVEFILIFISVSMAAALMIALYPDLANTFGKSTRRRLAPDALWTASVAALLFFGLRSLRDVLVFHFPKFATMNHSPAPAAIDAPLPFLSYMTEILLLTVLVASMSGIFIFLFRKFVRKPLVLVSLFAAGLLLMLPAGAKTAGEIFLSCGTSFLLLLGAYLLVLCFAKNNYLAYIVAPVVVLACAGSLSLLSLDNAWLKANGFLLLGSLLLFAAWIVLPGLIKGSS
jgi:membrane protease YdiL (CAAX protease family)